MRAGRLSHVPDPSAYDPPLSTEGRYAGSIRGSPSLTRGDCSRSFLRNTPSHSGRLLADQNKCFHTHLFVAVLREVVVVVGVVVSDNSIGQVMSNPPASPVHAQTTSRRLSSHARRRYQTASVNGQTTAAVATIARRPAPAFAQSTFATGRYQASREHGQAAMMHRSRMHCSIHVYNSQGALHICWLVAHLIGRLHKKARLAGQARTSLKVMLDVRIQSEF